MRICGGAAFRDRCMADNARWVLEQEPAGTRMLLWAHNGHVKKDGPPYGLAMMGNFLAQALGGEHVAIGLGFHHGGFQAVASPRAEGGSGALPPCPSAAKGCATAPAPSGPIPAVWRGRTGR